MSAPERPDLDGIEQRANEATPGPWGSYYGQARHGRRVPRVRSHALPAPEGKIADPWDMTDAAFIAAARSDVPELVAYARHLEAKVVKQRKKIRKLKRSRRPRSSRIPTT